MGSVTFTPQYLEPTATHYRAALEVSLNDGEIAKLVVEVPRTEAVDRVAQRIKQIVESAPVGADLTAWYADGRDGGEPGAGYLKLVAHEGRAMVMERAAVMVKQRRLPALVKEFCGEWTTATADRAHAFLSQARAGDVLNLGVLQALQVWAEGGDPRAQQAVRRLNFINEGVAKGLPRRWSRCCRRSTPRPATSSAGSASGACSSTSSGSPSTRCLVWLRR
jgi:hypothetical protein